MPAERAAWPFVVALAAGGTALGATPAAGPKVEPLDPEMVEFLAEFSVSDGFIDPFALDRVGKAVDQELKKLDEEQAKAAKTAPPASKEDDDGQ